MAVSEEPRSSGRAASENHLINAIRTLAAFAVLAGHIRMFFFRDYLTVPHNPAAQLGYTFASLGGEAVLVFFALSGYWVGGAVLDKCRTGQFVIREYLTARLTRLWIVVLPALALTFCVDRAGMTFFGTADVYANPTAHTGKPFTHAPHVLLGNIFFVQDLHVPVFGHDYPLWSLSYEFWFYCIFGAVTVLVVGRQRRTRLLALAVVAVGSVIAGGPVLELFPAWLIGVGAAALKPQAVRWAARSTVRRIRFVRRVSVGALLVVMAGTHLAAAPLQISGVLIGAATAVLLWTLITDVTKPPGRAVRVANRLAGCSFSLYAIHMPVVVLAAAVLVPHYGQRWELAGPAGLFLIPACAVVALLAMGFARLTEDQTARVRRRLQARPGMRVQELRRPVDGSSRLGRLPRQRTEPRRPVKR
ncbi:MAG TPA: acyltransferase [Sporichthyaceae bacterium]|jgi:peptidoglycan/LPS O-acetylase OafA/YrhL|nr:acyltransferase [Sporichthyaceae bacterium]